jgi:putative N-acetylmannosamine-6-phosphate epimerase
MVTSVVLICGIQIADRTPLAKKEVSPTLACAYHPAGAVEGLPAFASKE